ncbi:DUF6115 domain-containing protein [Leptospirillum ferriphilum]|jgi:hypothetical protein|uniref:DUF6115 domain-containing protein n=1 Tax=Leptospirillum ferriphilum TaxID=178606 RepID=UPI0006B1967B|nr:hypothetical protein [Leptospirillum ferriphilum]
MSFAVFQGILDGTLLIFLAVLLAYVRVVRGQLRRLTREKTASSGVREETGEGMGLFRESREALEKTIREMDALSREAAGRTDRLKLLLHDAQQWLEDLERLEKGPTSDPASGTPPPEQKPSASGQSSGPHRPSRSEPRTDIEKVLYLMEQGKTVPEIAQSMGRGEGEIELMLGLSRLSDSRSGPGR